MANRVIAIGDVHGCLRALTAIFELVRPSTQDTVVMLGDYVNRGPDSRGVIEMLAASREQCQLIPLLGNHDQLLLRNRATRIEVPGYPAFDSDNRLERFREDHFEFLETCRLYLEIDSHFFVHANYDPKKPLGEQNSYTMLWISLNDQMPKRHCSGKTAIVGHTSQRNGEVLDRGHLKCLDTYCYGGGWLTAMDVKSGRIWQVDRNGKSRIRKASSS